MNFNEIYDNKSAGPKLKTNPKYNQIFQICFSVTLWQSKKRFVTLNETFWKWFGIKQIIDKFLKQQLWIEIFLKN